MAIDQEILNRVAYIEGIVEENLADLKRDLAKYRGRVNQILTSKELLQYRLKFSQDITDDLVSNKEDIAKYVGLLEELRDTQEAIPIIEQAILMFEMGGRPEKLRTDATFPEVRD